MNKAIRLTLLGLALLVPARVAACSIPVFRYALEHWRPSPYEVLAFHRGPLPTTDLEALKNLEERDTANVTVSRVNLAGKVDPELRKLWQEKAKKALPHVLVRYPDSDGSYPLAWSGPLERQHLASLLDSPTRQRVVRLLTSGESAVFVLLESGDARLDQEAAELLQTELDNLEKMIELPVQDSDGPQLQSELPLKVSFPVLRLSAKAPEEQAFVQMLLGSEDGLPRSGRPIAFPIFGRGRVLCGLHGKDLNARELEGVARFLCGACSCQVKELNPGVDLLLLADWDALLETPPPPIPDDLPAVATTPTIPPGLPESTPIPAPPPAPRLSSRTELWVGLGLVGLLVLLTGAWVLSSRQPPLGP